jgi:stage III sporulation protein AD
MSMIKIGMIGIAAVFLALLLKKEKGELALLVGIAASVLIFGYTLSRISFILDFLRELMDTLPALLKALLKMLGITYVADFSASVCREAGYGSVAGQIELFAKLSIVALSIPELWVLLRLIEQMTGG